MVYMYRLQNISLFENSKPADWTFLYQRVFVKEKSSSHRVFQRREQTKPNN